MRIVAPLEYLLLRYNLSFEPLKQHNPDFGSCHRKSMWSSIKKYQYSNNLPFTQFVGLNSQQNWMLWHLLLSKGQLSQIPLTT